MSQSDRVAVVSSRWHGDIVGHAVDTFCREVDAHPRFAVDRFEVPGAFEIPLRVQRLARSGIYAAIAACAFIVDGGIYRHEFVAHTVLDALMRIQLDEETPVFSAVLTPHAFHEHYEHRMFFSTHFVVKGQELAQALLQVCAADAEHAEPAVS
ncbi:6,7-dimethyl-8-ribityllumazine synthase [Mycolicibacterium mageritense]|nr:6,7-dimethyl-8-ribityllumazine synthase [Mycolicibacterium mageritense]MCC9180220.1 6,7-dimethyl-8-ribityllumazine synthase [Mycolicibacterium mageritense]